MGPQVQQRRVTVADVAWLYVVGGALTVRGLRRVWNLLHARLWRTILRRAGRALIALDERTRL